ncbi:MAG: biopolymer transporter ExbD [Phycisphaerales bacterium]|nr:MAG: biopolymer transporter ExbD [Phycisphaerales bacterium]
MRRRFRSISPHARGHAGFAKVNVTPLIDVVMCLIIFYLIVGRLASDRSAGVQLPTTGVGATRAPEDRLVINVLTSDDGPKVVIENVPIERGMLRERVAAFVESARTRGETPDVQLRADRTLAWGDLSWIVGECREAGLGALKLAAQRGEGGGGGAGGTP